MHLKSGFFYLSSRASDYGLMKIDRNGQIIKFTEKPKGADLKAMVSMLILEPILLCPVSKLHTAVFSLLKISFEIGCYLNKPNLNNFEAR